MKKIEAADFLTYKTISSLTYSPSGACAGFILTTPDDKENSYHQELWLYESEALRPLVHGAVRSFIWDSDDTVLYPAEPKNKEERLSGSFTAYYRQGICQSEPVWAFTLPICVTDIKKIRSGLYFVTGTCDANYPEYHSMSQQERELIEQAKKEQADYEVLDEIPFWANGSGFINKQRKRPFLYREADHALIPLAGPLFELAAAAVSGQYVLFAGESYEQKPLKRAQIYRYNIQTERCEKIYGGTDYFIQNMEAVGNQFILVASTFQRFGVEENYCFYKVEPESGAISLLADADIYINNSLGCDCRYGQTRSIKGTDSYLYFITTQRKTAQLYRLSLDGQITPMITQEGSVDDFDLCGDTILLTGLYQMLPQELYRYSLCSNSLEPISAFQASALADRYIARPQPILFQNHEVEMDGWVLLPIDYDPKGTYPAVLSIHGGPRTIYGPTFHHEMQMLASAGFFVFFCNPEGSSGCGNVFGDLRGKYGTIDYEDLMVFTDVVLEQYPQIDKNRVCAIGGSYGGFMVNWIIGHTDRFAAAVSQRSISNWVSFCGYSDIGPWFGLDQQAATPYDGVERMWEHSPLKYADRAVTPTLFIHSDEDYRCNMPEGIQMYTALMNHGVPCRFCYFRGENHDLSRSGKPLHRLRRLQEILDWLIKYTK